MYNSAGTEVMFTALNTTVQSYKIANSKCKAMTLQPSEHSILSRALLHNDTSQRHNTLQMPKKCNIVILGINYIINHVI